MHPARQRRTTAAITLFAAAALLATLLPAVLGAAETAPENTAEGRSTVYGPREFVFPHSCVVWVRKTADADVEWEVVGALEPGGGAVSIPPCYAWAVSVRALEPSWTWERLARELRRAEVPGLKLRGTEITDAVLAHLKDLGHLQDLDLGWCKSITDAGLAHVKDLGQLQALDLTWCINITDTGLAHLTGLGQLRELHLTGCNITDAGLAHLKDLGQLRELALFDCRRITSAGVQRIRKALPQCRVTGP